jgi:hypothetical protein
MFVFMDESGTADIPGPQPYFALSAIAFQTEGSRDQMNDIAKQLRQEWRVKATFEFRFVDLNHDNRTKFFVKVGGLSFRHSTCVLRKEGLGGQWAERCYLYERVLREVVGGLMPFFRQVDAGQHKPLKVRVVFDEHKDPDYSRILKAEFGKLRSKDGSRMVVGVKPGRSRSSNLLQLADMVCGAARWDTSTYRKFIAAQCLRIYNLP